MVFFGNFSSPLAFSSFLCRKMLSVPFITHLNITVSFLFISSSRCLIVSGALLKFPLIPKRSFVTALGKADSSSLFLAFIPHPGPPGLVGGVEAYTCQPSEALACVRLVSVTEKSSHCLLEETAPVPSCTLWSSFFFLRNSLNRKTPGPLHISLTKEKSFLFL